MSISIKTNIKSICSPLVQWLVMSLVCVLLVVIFFDGLEKMVSKWFSSEEYSHGVLIPFITGFMIWQKKDLLSEINADGSWAGLIVIAFGLALYVLGDLSTLYVVVQYAFLVTLMGAVLTFIGWEKFKKIWVPLCFLFFMIPLPSFIYNNLSSELQLISSQIGVVVIRLFNISVFLEGNVIDLGSYKLQVVEACSGLRYLFPLMSFGFISAYFFKARFWMRVMVFLSTIPITVLLNSFRIGVIGVLVEHWGIGAADGFLHYFEGWIIFIVCIFFLISEIWLLNRFFGNGVNFRDAFVIDFPESSSELHQIQNYTLSKPLLVSILLLGITVILSSLLTEREEVIPQRADFADFPMPLDGWLGQRKRMDVIYLDELKLTDYVDFDYVNNNDKAVNFYVAYYDSQRKGQSAHSPRSCLPGGGWRINDLSKKILPNTKAGNQAFKVNRLEIQLGDVTQIVYYWFQQRGRVITSEYMVKWFLFWDALTKNRTDGALVRVSTIVEPGESLVDADNKLVLFTKTVQPYLNKYIPD